MSSNSSHIVDRYKSSPSWLKALVLLSIVYACHHLWTRIIRTRREIQAASWILNERRKAGIPDSDKRPFKIAKADVEANRKKSSDSAPPASASLSRRSVSLQPPSPNAAHSSLRKSHLIPPSINEDRNSVISRTSHQPQVPSAQNNRLSKPHPPLNPLTISKNSPSLRTSPSEKSTPSASPSSPALSNQPPNGRSLQKRVAPLSTDGSDPDQPEIQQADSTIRNRKKAKTQKNPPPSSLNSELAIPGNFSDNPSPQIPDSHVSPKNLRLRKKRILSDCVGEMDHDQAIRIKKGRSENLSGLDQSLTPTKDKFSEAPAPIQVEEESEVEGGEKDDHDELNEEKKEADAERYMHGKDGQKRKLVRIRLNSPESNESPGEGAAEFRWVTRRQFQDLEQRGMLLIDDEWEGDSITSADSLNSSAHHLCTPARRTASIAIERGPIWSIEGKKSISTSSLSASETSPKLPSVSRPRNSLGRIRLSLPPDPASPLQRSRSRLLSPLRPSIS